MIVAIIGEGEWAKALFHLVAEAGHTPRLGYQKKCVPGFQGTPNLARLCREAELVIYACPANDLFSLVQESKLHPRNRVLISARSLEPKTGRWLSSVITEESPALRVGALAGPVILKDIERGHPSALVVASHYDQVLTLTQEVLHSGICRVYSSKDLIGVELAGAMVTMISMGIGLADSLRKGFSARGVIVARGLAEASRLGQALGAEEHSFLGLAGVGDVVAFGMRGAKYEAGRNIGAKKAIPTYYLAELEALIKLGQKQSIDLPLTQAILAIAKGELEAEIAMDALMQRAPTAE